MKKTDKLTPGDTLDIASASMVPGYEVSKKTGPKRTSLLNKMWTPPSKKKVVKK